MELYKKHISDLGRIVTGKTPRTSISENYGGHIPFLTPSDDLSGKYAYKTSKTLSELGLKEVKNCLLPPNSICVSCIGSDLGKVIITNKPTVTNQQFNSIIPNEENNADFVYYLMSVVGKHLNFLSKTSTAVPIINKSSFSDFEIEIPSLDDQIRIATVLSSLDEKIECNRQINDNFTLSFLLLTCFVLWLLKLRNDNLEQQAQALFKSWFVDFEPYKDSGFEETEIGRIPKDLLVKRVSEIPHTIETGRRPKGGVGEITSGVPSVGAEHVKGLGNYDYSKTKYITEEYAASLKTGKVNGYELLIYKDGGKPGYFIPNYSIFGEGYPFEECFLNEHVFKLEFGDKGYNAFCYFYFWTDYVMNYLNAQGGKAAIPGINRQDIENIQIFAPENELVKRFGDIVLPSIRQILFNCKESRRLSQLRDALLPRLMSGELKVNEIEMP